MKAIRRAVLAFRIWRRRKAIVELAMRVAPLKGGVVRMDWAAEHLARADKLAREAVMGRADLPAEYGRAGRRLLGGGQ